MIRTAAFLLALPTLGFAHPHIFVDTDMILRVDEEGALYEVELAFAYDEFFSLLIIEDMGVDPDGDGILTEAEKAKLFGFDVANWPDGFEGDFYVGVNGENVSMQRSMAIGLDVVDGKLVATQTRPIPFVEASQAVIRQYDPTFYVHYTLQNVSVEGPCESKIDAHDPSAGDRAVEEALKTVSDDVIDTLELGIYYADTIRLTCSAGS